MVPGHFYSVGIDVQDGFGLRLIPDIRQRDPAVVCVDQQTGLDETLLAAFRIGEGFRRDRSSAVLTVEKVNFDCTIRGGYEHIRPVRVFDDGAKTYIQMPAELEQREAPVLLVLGKDGKGEMTN